MKKKILFISSAFLSLTLAILWFLVATQSGTVALVALGNSILPGHLSAQTTSGTLKDRITLEGVRYIDSEVAVQLGKVSLSCDILQLWHRRVAIESLQLSKLHLVLYETGGKEPDSHFPESFRLPFHLSIATASLQDMTMVDQQGTALQGIEALNLDNVTMEDNELILGELQIKTTLADFSFSGRLKTTDDYDMQLAFRYLLHLPEYVPVTGGGSITGPLDKLLLKADNTSPVAATLAAEIENPINNLKWQGELQSSDLRLAGIYPALPDLYLSSLTFSGAGTLDNYALEIVSKVAYSAAGHEFSLAGRLAGNHQGLDVPDLTISNGPAVLAGQGKLRWGQGYLFEAELTGTSIDPSLVFHDWPGKIDLNTVVAGEFVGNSFRASIDLTSLQGTLRGYPLTGQGKVELIGNTLVVESLELSSSDSTVTVTGQYKDEVDLEFQLRSPDLSQLWPEASGKVDIAGLISGTMAAPRINVNASAQDMRLGDKAVGAFTAMVEGSLGPEGIIKSTMMAEKVHFQGVAIDKGDLTLEGSYSGHILKAQMENQDGVVSLQLDGGLNENQWLGKVNHAEFITAEHGKWSARHNSSLLVSADKVDLERVCFVSDRDDQACLKGDWHSTGGWSMDTVVSSLSLGSINTFLSQPLPLDGVVEGTISLSGDLEKLTHGAMAFRVVEPVFHGLSAKALEQTLAVQQNEVTATFQNRQLEMEFNLTLADSSLLNGRLRMDNIEPLAMHPESTTIVASALFNVHDISPFGFVFNDAAALSGSLEGRIGIQGMLAHPVLDGRLELLQGKAVIPALGITIAPLTATIKGDNADRLTFIATATSGQGDIQAKGEIRVTTDRLVSVTCKVHGQQFDIVQLPELSMCVSPHLSISWNSGGGVMEGEITIPSARIAPVDLSGAITPSRDVVIVDTEEETQKDDVSVSSRIKLVAGDDVLVDAYGLTGKLKGELIVLDEPNRPQTGQGVLRVEEGVFSLYGRRLQLDIGRLLFTGGPLTDPGVEVRAENKSDGITTGVEVTGFLRRPEMNFYSDPYMEQHEILSRLLVSSSIGGSTREDAGVIGKVLSKVGLGEVTTLMENSKKILNIDDIKVEAGDGFDDLSLIIGSWLTPRLYISYGRNLLKESGSFNTRYSLGKGFYLQTETGTTQSGGDLKYEIEH